MIKKLVIIDHFLTANKGHDEQYDFSIIKAAVDRGLLAEVWCPPRQEKDQPGFVKQCLMRPFWKRKNRLAAIIAAFSSVFEWRRIFKNTNLDASTIVLIQTIKPPILLFLALASLGITVKARFVVVLRREMNLWLLKYLYHQKGFLFLPDSELITEWLKANGMRKAKTLPIPHVPPKAALAPRSGNHVIGYFGEARYDKGFDLLPPLAAAILEKHNDIDFIIQANIHRSTGLMEKALKHLKELRVQYPGKIEIIEGYVNEGAYFEYMKRCSIVLVPYRKEYYGMGTSGILAEAIAFGAWVIVPEGTWMANQKEKYKKIAIFDFPDVKGIFSAVRLCLENDRKIDPESLKSQIDHWYRFHSANNYLAVLLDITK